MSRVLRATRCRRTRRTTRRNQHCKYKTVRQTRRKRVRWSLACAKPCTIASARNRTRHQRRAARPLHTTCTRTAARSSRRRWHRERAAVALAVLWILTTARMASANLRTHSCRRLRVSTRKAAASRTLCLAAFRASAASRLRKTCVEPTCKFVAVRPGSISLRWLKSRRAASTKLLRPTSRSNLRCICRGASRRKSSTASRCRCRTG
mmetsp:Transcript_54971/g.147195  ORF Transcript_54971/g.147195 Transcript_54971/m.147195 type:complete len:207 (-) Transcript_54971:1002-1622(-)